MNELASLHPTDLGWDQTRFSPSNVRFLEAPHNISTLRYWSPRATWSIYDPVGSNIMTLPGWKNTKLYKLNRTSTNTRDTFASACSVSSGASRTCACSGAAGSSFAPAGGRICMRGSAGAEGNLSKQHTAHPAWVSNMLAISEQATRQHAENYSFSSLMFFHLRCPASAHPGSTARLPKKS